MLDLAQRLVVIVGGGAVAARKAAGVVEAGAARVRCVAPLFKGDFPPCVEKVPDRYNSRHLEGAGLVFASTDSAEVNDAVVRDARAMGALVSRADNGQGAAGDFSTPAVLRRSAVTVTVSAASPALSAMVRDGLAARWDPRWSNMADAMHGLRPLLTAGGLHPDRRADILRDLATEEALSVLDGGGETGLLDWLAGRHAELKEWNAEIHATGAINPIRQAQDTPDHA
jgi:precorrin-2 dehydrogenase/sirohydrochlorin ferrochelatase